VENKDNAGLIAHMELDGVTTLLLIPALPKLIVLKMTTVLEIVNGMVLPLLFNPKLQLLNLLLLKA